MSRVAMANQCRATKPAEPTDQKIVQCQRELGHPGPHSSGPHFKWTSEYHQGEKK